MLYHVFDYFIKNLKNESKITFDAQGPGHRNPRDLLISRSFETIVSKEKYDSVVFARRHKIVLL